MRRFGPIIYTLVSTCLTSTAFQISPPIPSHPSESSFQKLQIAGPDPGQSESLPLDEDREHQENEYFTLTFSNSLSFLAATVENNDLSTTSLERTVLDSRGGTGVAGEITSVSGNIGDGVTPESLIGIGDVNATRQSPNSIGDINATNQSPNGMNQSPNGIGNTTVSGVQYQSHVSSNIGHDTTVPPTLTSTVIFTTLAQSQSEKSRPRTGLIAGCVAGGVLVVLVVTTFALCILRRRNKKLKYNLGPTPYLDMTPSSGSDTPYMDSKIQMLCQRERLERELEAYEQASQESNSRNEDGPDGINGSNQQDDVVQVTRRQMEVLTRRIAALEAVTMAPPDYSSHTSQ
ncbi:hypothetical protein E1B28_013109 [Marasmius oreades]|uniref:Uncharacterized protein n=1 Tax=Marasmius oreades TaxID=181124 RepID=A0A9P7RPX2_9AGAR|nr:uncharacterized protein E1B28_013109 [Marasmius oreades]KAG7087130.1 hypothetical protein E1B28_013109 [Marasmius oreades]